MSSDDEEDLKLKNKTPKEYDRVKKRRIEKRRVMRSRCEKTKKGFLMEEKKTAQAQYDEKVKGIKERHKAKHESALVKDLI